MFETTSLTHHYPPPALDWSVQCWLTDARYLTVPVIDRYGAPSSLHSLASVFLFIPHTHFHTFHTNHFKVKNYFITYIKRNHVPPWECPWDIYQEESGGSLGIYRPNWYKECQVPLQNDCQLAPPPAVFGGYCVPGLQYHPATYAFCQTNRYNVISLLFSFLFLWLLLNLSISLNACLLFWFSCELPIHCLCPFFYWSWLSLP